MPNESRILALDGTAHPKALVTSVDAASGVLSFRWLDAAGNPVDSGGSVARFTPVAPNPSDPGEPITYPDIPDETLIDAIANPPPPPVPVVLQRDQFVIAIRRVLGLDEGGVYALIAQLPAGDTQDTARDRWENTRVFRRDSTLLNALAQINGNTSAEVDEVFRVGAALNLD